MTILITIVHIIVCFVLIAVILLQAGRGQGLTGASFGGGNVQSLFGTRAGDFLTKATTVCAILFMVTCISLDYIEARRSRSLLETDRAAAPLNLDEIQKALQKVKEESGVEGKDVVDTAAAEKTLDSVLEGAKEAVEVAAAEADALVKQLPDAGSETPDVPES